MDVFLWVTFIHLWIRDLYNYHMPAGNWQFVRYQRLTLSRQARTAVNVEWRSSRVGESKLFEMADEEDSDEAKLSGEKQTKNGLNLSCPSSSG